MSKREMKPGNMLYPLPVVLVSCRGKDGKDNFITVAWAGTVCSEPPMLSVSIRKERFSHDMISETGEFAVNLTNEDMALATDLAGVKSGRDVDKWALCGLHREKAQKIGAPLIKEAPVSIECKVREILPLGSHDCYIAEVVAVSADEKYYDENGRFDMDACRLMTYTHGEYHAIGRRLGTFGYSVKKEKKTVKKAGESVKRENTAKTKKNAKAGNRTSDSAE